MDATRISMQDEETMKPTVELRRAGLPTPTQASSAGAAPTFPPVHPLPPTRAARQTRSRGVFFQRGGRSRPGRWIVNALFAAAVTVSIVASAHFAEPAFDAAMLSNNAGPALVASTLQASAFVAPRRASPRRSH
jgi:hypothetical protein